MLYKLELRHNRVANSDDDGEERSGKDQTCCDRRRSGVVCEGVAEGSGKRVRTTSSKQGTTHRRLMYTRRPATKRTPRRETRRWSIVRGEYQAIHVGSYRNTQACLRGQSHGGTRARGATVPSNYERATAVTLKCLGQEIAHLVGFT